MTDWVAIIGSGVAVLTPLGTASAFVWNKVEKRFASIELELKACRAREHTSGTRGAVQLTVIELLWQEVQRHAPGSIVLDRAKHLLDDLKEKASLDALTSAAASLELLIESESKR